MKGVKEVDGGCKSMQKSASKTELLKYFDFNASVPTASALIQQRKTLPIKGVRHY